MENKGWFGAVALLAVFAAYSAVPKGLGRPTAPPAGARTPFDKSWRLSKPHGTGRYPHLLERLLELYGNLRFQGPPARFGATTAFLERYRKSYPDRQAWANWTFRAGNPDVGR